MDKIFIVMDYVEHDLKALMETMKAPFLPGMCVHSFGGCGFDVFCVFFPRVF